VVVRDLWKVFDHGGRRIEVLRGIDLDLQPGALVSIVGASGVGKSTLLHLLGTLDEPSKGTIAFDGVNVTSLAPGKLANFRNQSIGFVFQFHHLLPEFTALENVMMPGLIARLRARSVPSGLRPCWYGWGWRNGFRTGRASFRAASSSGSPWRGRSCFRLGFCSATSRRAISTPRLGQAMHDLFFELNRELGMTLLLVTHNNELAGRAYRKLRMIDGQVVEET
jgi:lipoprotein-releasing system ATP-binding protein